MKLTGTRTTPIRAVANDSTANCQQLCESSASRSPLPSPSAARAAAVRDTAASSSANVSRVWPLTMASLPGTRAAVRCSISLMPCRRASPASPPPISSATMPHLPQFPRQPCTLPQHPRQRRKSHRRHARTSPSHRHLTLRAGPPTRRQAHKLPTGTSTAAAWTARLGYPMRLVPAAGGASGRQFTTQTVPLVRHRGTHREGHNGCPAAAQPCRRGRSRHQDAPSSAQNPKSAWSRAVIEAGPASAQSGSARVLPDRARYSASHCRSA